MNNNHSKSGSQHLLTPSSLARSSTSADNDNDVLVTMGRTAFSSESFMTANDGGDTSSEAGTHSTHSSSRISSLSMSSLGGGGIMPFMGTPATQLTADDKQLLRIEIGKWLQATTSDAAAADKEPTVPTTVPATGNSPSKKMPIADEDEEVTADNYADILKRLAEEDAQGAGDEGDVNVGALLTDNGAATGAHQTQQPAAPADLDALISNYYPHMWNILDDSAKQLLRERSSTFGPSDIRISQQKAIGKYVTYCIALLKGTDAAKAKPYDAITVHAIGDGIATAVRTVNIIKSRLKGLVQETSIDTVWCSTVYVLKPSASGSSSGANNRGVAGGGGGAESPYVGSPMGSPTASAPKSFPSANNHPSSPPQGTPRLPERIVCRHKTPIIAITLRKEEVACKAEAPLSEAAALPAPTKAKGRKGGIKPPQGGGFFDRAAD